MNQIQLYLDEDAMYSRLVTVLRSRGVIVVTVIEAGLTAVSDEEQLAFATERGCVLSRSIGAISIDYTSSGPALAVNTPE